MIICTILVVYFALIEKNQLKILRKKLKIKIKLNEMQNELNENPNKFNGGTFFVVFDNMKMKDTFCKFFPNSYFSKIMWSIRYFFGNVICEKCMNKGRKDISRLKLSIDVV